ncbi:hypothetical protein Tco_0016912 [Tanacetum coccineum]
MYRVNYVFSTSELPAFSPWPEESTRGHESTRKGKTNRISKRFQKQDRAQRKPRQVLILTNEGPEKRNFALEKRKFKAQPPMIDEMIKAGKLSTIHQKTKTNDKTNAKKRYNRKESPLAILMIQPWEKVVKAKGYPKVSLQDTPTISFPTLGDEDGTKGPMINLRAEIGGHFHAPNVTWTEEHRNENLYDTVSSRLRLKKRSQIFPAYHIPILDQWGNQLPLSKLHC